MRRTVRRAAGAATVVVVLVTGCGSTSPGTAGTARPEGSTGTPTELLVEVSGRPAVTLVCDPPGGDVTDPETACTALDAGAAAALAAPEEGTACTQEYGGPETARITGSYRGEAVDVRVSRTDGCGIARWATLEPLLGSPAGATAGGLP